MQKGICVRLQLSLTEKGLRKMMEMSKSYRHALLDSDVLDLFKVSERHALCLTSSLLSALSAQTHKLHVALP